MFVYVYLNLFEKLLVLLMLSTSARRWSTRKRSFNLCEIIVYCGSVNLNMSVSVCLLVCVV